MRDRRRRCTLIPLALSLLVVSGVHAQTGSAGPLDPLAPLLGAWDAQGPGFSTTLRYRWAFPGTVLEATNEVRDGEGRLIARYHGLYVWDAGKREVAFLTASGSGEVHRGRAWLEDGVLWHEADVSGGSVEAYASALRFGNGRLEYFAEYGARSASPALLDTQPLSYAPQPPG